MPDIETLNHTKWDCKYHVVFIPKYWCKALYKELRQHLRDVFRSLADQKECRIGYSSATTLIMNRLKFSGQKFSKCPNMIRQSGGHARGSMIPLGSNQSRSIRTSSKSHIASYKKPQPVDIVDELPKNFQGKILTRVLRERYVQGGMENSNLGVAIRAILPP